MADAKFTHLHVHTHYSLLDGANKIPELVRQAKKLGMDSLAITDHGCMFGVVEFFNECKKEGIKPILGMEAYMAPGDRRDKSGTPGETAYHLLLLAQNLEGYHNLLKLSSSAYRDGFYYKPRIDKEILREHQRGLIATSACLGGEIPSAFMRRGKMAEAKATAETYLDIFGPDRFFIEVQNHIKEQNEVNPELAELARKTGVGLVGTNDVHFLTADDHRVHDVLCCISMGKLQSDESRLKYPKELYLKSPAEMVTALGSFDGAIENTTRIAAMCDLQLDFSKRYAPVYKVEPEKLDDAIIPPGLPAATLVPIPEGQPVPEMKADERYLRQLCETGLEWRYGTRDVPKPVRDRLEYEITVIAAKNFCSYFLINWDFCNYARSQGIPVGARGSGVGSMVAFLLGLCNVDPLTYKLLFERFMDPSRNEMPDIDIDICQDGRQKVIEYVRNKYGHVAQIITFGTLAAKAACKDVGRVLGVPLAEIDRLTKLIPGTPGMTLKKAIEKVPELDALIKSSPVVKNVIDYAMKLEGMCRNAGCHAAGVIIADQPLDGIVPLYRDSDGNVLTQFEGPVAEKCGLLKMDFLGLRTLTSLTRSIDLEHQTRETRPVKWPEGQPVPAFDKYGKYDIDKVDLTDPTVYKLFQRGETGGVFQFESGGMRDLLMKMVPDRIEDLIAANALYRPGPMELIPTYCARKHGKEPVPQVHPIMDAILAETYGIMCIHEDVRVSMADGTERPIKDVRRGDRVHSLNYATQQFEIKECHGCGPTRRGDGVRIALENGFSVTLTDDHRVLTYGGLKEAGTLDPAVDLVAVGRQLAQEAPSYSGIAEWLGADEDVAYLFGALVGDGCLTTSGITIATGRERDHLRFVQWVNERMPAVRVHGYFHGRCWYAGLSHPQLLNLAPHGNRKTRLHQLLDTHGLKTNAQRKRVPEFIFRCAASVRNAFLAGLLDADGCTAVNSRGIGVCFLTSTSTGLLEDVRRLAQLDGISTTIRKHRIQFWSLLTLSQRLGPYLMVRQFTGTLTEGHTVGWVPRSALLSAIPERESVRAFSARTGIMRAGLKHDFPFCKSSTAAKAGIDLGHVRYFRITSVERVHGQQFYGMSVADHHNLVANGIVVKNCYQEQVMQVFNQLGGIELSNAYKLIKAISKKNTEIIAKFKPDFLRGTMEKGVSKEKAEEIFDFILKFGGYGFNKSHSARYAIVAYQTAYMKAYHPVEYMSAVLTFEMGSTEKVVEYIEECRRMTLADGAKGIRVLPPDVNVSLKDFTPVYTTVAEKPKGRGKAKPKVEGVIRFGLAAVRGVGEKAVETIVAERSAKGDYPNLYDFCERVDLRAVPRATIEALVKCGAFASTGGNRAQLMQVVDRAFEAGQQAQSDRRSGQAALWGSPAEALPSAASMTGAGLPDAAEFEDAELLKFEKELLGFYITSHPLTDHQVNLERFSTASTKEAMLLGEGTEVTVGGMIARVKKVVTKNGRSAGMQMAIITLEDLDGQIDGTMFAETFAEVQAKYPDAIAAERIVFVKGKVDKKKEIPGLIVNEVIPVTDAVARLTTAVCVKLDPARHDAAIIADVPAVLARHRGTVPVYFQVSTAAGKAMLQIDKQHAIKPSPALVDDVEQLLGHDSVDLAGAGAKRRKRLEQQRLFKDESAEPTAEAEAAAEVVPGPELEEVAAD
jgi:DNA polymerase-3 subunit alpha